MQTNTISTDSTINGIDLEQLKGAMEAIQNEPSNGMTSWRVRSSWMGGTRSDHHVEGFTIGGEFVPRPFTIRIDEPHQLTGSNQFPNPQEYLMSAMNACMMVGYAAVAGLMSIKLTKLEVETSGDIDLRGFLGLDDSVPNGYVKLDQVVRISADASDEQLEQLHDTVKRTSPNFFNITRAIEVDSRLLIE